MSSEYIIIKILSFLVNILLIEPSKLAGILQKQKKIT